MYEEFCRSRRVLSTGRLQENELPRFLGQQFNNLQWAAILMSLVQYDKILSKFGQQYLIMVNYMYACF